jgi:hypothetical protein
MTCPELRGRQSIPSSHSVALVPTYLSSGRMSVSHDRSVVDVRWLWYLHETRLPYHNLLRHTHTVHSVLIIIVATPSHTVTHWGEMMVVTTMYQLLSALHSCQGSRKRSYRYYLRRLQTPSLGFPCLSSFRHSPPLCCSCHVAPVLLRMNLFIPYSSALLSGTRGLARDETLSVNTKAHIVTKKVTTQRL